MKNEKVDYNELNDCISLSKKILKIVFVVLILGIVFLVIYLSRELQILPIIGNVLKLISPLFIGIIIAWLLDPIVTWLTKKKVNRTLSTIFVFFFFIILAYVILRLLIPILSNQINDFVGQVPTFFLEIKSFIHEFFQKITLAGVDLSSIENTIYSSIEGFGTSITTSLPSTLINTVSSLVSSVGNIILGLVVSFYLLLDFQNINKALDFVPKKYHESIKVIGSKLNGTFRDYVQGLLLIALIVSILSTIGYSIVGLPSALLFGILCGITNIIPYIGPWIGGGICVIIGFTISPVVGVLTIIVAVIVQQLDNVILEPLIYGKAMKLHPVTIMIALLVFGYFFGIFGMILATPITACLKLVFNYFDEKYSFTKKIKAKNKEELV